MEDAEADLRNGETIFFALEPESDAADSGFIPNLNIVHVPGAPPSPERIAGQIAKSVEQEVDVKGEVQAGTAELSAGRVALVTYVVPSEAAGDARVTQFAFPRENDGFILTL